jgi:hypothetical protein
MEGSWWKTYLDLSQNGKESWREEKKGPRAKMLESTYSARQRQVLAFSVTASAGGDGDGDLFGRGGVGRCRHGRCRGGGGIHRQARDKPMLTLCQFQVH